MFLNWLKDPKKIILFDGAMGTEIIKRGIEAGKITDSFNLERPEVIKEIHQSYFNSGSDMVQTCTFGSSYLSLKRYSLDDKIELINRKALENLSSVRPDNKLIVGDVGPSGEFRPPIGKANPNDWVMSFSRQIQVLKSGVDLWHIETISDLEEMVAAITAIRKHSNKPIIASMTYQKTKRGFFTIMGDSPEKCINKLEELKVDVIGANCTLGSSGMIDLARELVDISNKPISVKPNAGQPNLVNGRLVYDQKAEDFVKDIEKMIDIGVKIVGGCCGTSPTHIKMIRKIIDSRR